MSTSSSSTPIDTPAGLAAAEFTPIEDESHTGAPIDEKARFGGITTDYKAAAQRETTYRLKGAGPMDDQGNRRYTEVGNKILMSVRAVLAHLMVIQDACMAKGEILFPVEMERKKESIKEMEKPVKEGEERKIFGYHLPPAQVVKLANPRLFASDPVVQQRVAAELEKIMKKQSEPGTKKVSKEQALEQAIDASALCDPKAEVNIPPQFRTALDRLKGLCVSLSDSVDKIDVALAIFGDATKQQEKVDPFGTAKKRPEEDMTLNGLLEVFVKWYQSFKPMADDLIAESRKLDRDVKLLVYPRTLVPLQVMISTVGERAAWAESELMFADLIRYCVPASKKLLGEIVGPHMVGLEAGEEVPNDKYEETMEQLQKRRQQLELEKVLVETKLKEQAEELERAALQAELPEPAEGKAEAEVEAGDGKEKQDEEEQEEAQAEAGVTQQ